MDKVTMREWISDLERSIDKKLARWLKRNGVETIGIIQAEWQFEQTHILIDIFWHDHEETVNLQYFGPRAKHHFTWHGLTNKTFNRIMDRVGNLAQITMYPIKDSEHE